MGLPTWENSDIIQLSLLSLERQINPPPYELIVYECGNSCTIEFWNRWSKRLRNAGCKKVVYLNSPTRIALSLKWRAMANEAQGEHFLLWASDDYSPPERLQKTLEADADWYNCRYGYSYHTKKKKLIMFDKGENVNKGGYQMSCRTSLFKQLPKEEKWKYVDSWIFNNIDVKKIVNDQEVYASVNTTGANSISKSRGDYFDKTIYPFNPTDKTIRDIGIPIDIVEMLINK